MLPGQSRFDHCDAQDTCDGLSDSIERNTPAEVPEWCAVEPSTESAQRTLSLAHRLSYTSFAPAGFEPGVTPLGAFQPPAPQDAHLKAAQLHRFAGAPCLLWLRKSLAPCMMLVQAAFALLIKFLAWAAIRGYDRSGQPC